MLLEGQPDTGSLHGSSSSWTSDSGRSISQRNADNHAISIPSLHLLSKLGARGVRGLIHKLPLEQLRKLPTANLISASLLDDGAIVLLSRRLGLPQLNEPLLPGITQHHLVSAFLSRPVSSRTRAETRWLSVVAETLCIDIGALRLDGGRGHGDQENLAATQKRVDVFRIAAYLGAPHSVILLRRMVELKLIHDDIFYAGLLAQPDPDSPQPHDLVRATLARAAREYGMDNLAADVGGPFALDTVHSRDAVRALAAAAKHPSARPSAVREWMLSAARWGEYALLAQVWLKVRPQRGVTTDSAKLANEPVPAESDKVPTDGAAVSLLRYLLASGYKGAARLLARDVLEGYHGLGHGFRARFISTAAANGFALSARDGFERFFGDKVVSRWKDGALVPQMALRLISLFLSIAHSPRDTKLVPDAHAFATRVAATCFPERRPPRTETHAALAARALFLLAAAPETPRSEATMIRLRALRDLRSTLFERKPRRVPTPQTANILVHELAKASLGRARFALSRMRRVDIGPDGVALSGVAFAGAGDVLGVPEYGGLRMLTREGRRGALRRVISTRDGQRGKLDAGAKHVVVELKDHAVWRWWKAHRRNVDRR